MRLALWYLLSLVPAGAIAYLVWAYRKKIAQKAAVSDLRFRELLAAGSPVAMSQAPAEDGCAAVTVPMTASASGIPAYFPKARLLDLPETLLYYVLKAGLPEHEIFAQVNLAAMLDVPQTAQGYGREQLRHSLARHCVDFLVCDKSARIVAVAEYEAATDSAAFKAACLKAAGIRHVLVKPGAVPKCDVMRALILAAGFPPAESGGGLAQIRRR